MHYCWHYTVNGPHVEEIKGWLEKEYNICCELRDFKEISIKLIVFEVEETHPHFEEIIHRLPQSSRGNRNNPDGFVTLIHIPVYSEEEYSAAKWLEVRSAFSKVIPENRADLFNPQCIIEHHRSGVPIGRHDVQVGSYVMKSAVKWGRNFFASADSNEYRLFCNRHARELLREHGLKGILFNPVLKKSTGEPFEDIYQLSGTYTVPSSAMIGLDYMEEGFCEQCGMKTLTPLDDRCRYGLQRGIIPEDLDFCQTQYMFLFPTKRAGYRRFLISQRMYRLIKDHLMDRSLYFTPMEMIENSSFRAEDEK